MTSPTQKTLIAMIEVVGEPVGQPKHGMMAIPLPAAGKCSHGFYRKWTARAHPITHIKNSDGSRKPHPIILWRKLIVVASKIAWPHRQVDCPVLVDRVFRFTRIQAHWGTGKNAGKLKASAPKYHSVQPDPDNCDKPLFDSLKIAGILRDDGRISDGRCTKLYCNPGEQPGCTITIYTLED